jgi:hypothetical protein
MYVLMWATGFLVVILRGPSWGAVVIGVVIVFVTSVVGLAWMTRWRYSTAGLRELYSTVEHLVAKRRGGDVLDAEKGEVELLCFRTLR